MKYMRKYWMYSILLGVLLCVQSPHANAYEQIIELKLVSIVPSEDPSELKADLSVVWGIDYRYVNSGTISKKKECRFSPKDLQELSSEMILKRCGKMVIYRDTETGQMEILHGDIAKSIFEVQSVWVQTWYLGDRAESHTFFNKCLSKDLCNIIMQDDGVQYTIRMDKY